MFFFCHIDNYKKQIIRVGETMEIIKNDWLSQIPTNCDTCHKSIDGTFVDGKTNMGPWALMCEKCHQKFGCGLGIGKGQKYQDVTGKFIEG